MEICPFSAHSIFIICNFRYLGLACENLSMGMNIETESIHY